MYFPDKETVTLEWDPNEEPLLAGYRVYYGLESNNYEAVIDVGITTVCTLSNLDSGETYFIAATAYNYLGYESVYSKEIVYNVPES